MKKTMPAETSPFSTAVKKTMPVETSPSQQLEIIVKYYIAVTNVSKFLQVNEVASTQ
jgi:hypothetical protein